MKVNELWDQFWDLPYDWEDDANMQWIENLLKEEPDNIDYLHLRLEILLGLGLDMEWEKQEPVFQNFCTSIIKQKETKNKIDVAKAYCYRGEIKYHGVDRRKDFDKAREILNELKQDDLEVKYLKKYIELEYPLMTRQYLFINENYLNMFKF